MSVKTIPAHTTNEVLNTYHQMLGNRKPVHQVIHEAHEHGAASTTAARVEESHRLRYRKPILAGLALTAAGLVGVTANEAGLHSDAQDGKDLYHTNHAGQVEEGQTHDLNTPITIEAPQSHIERP